MQARKEIVLALPAPAVLRIIPPRHQQPRQEASHVPPSHQQPRQEACDVPPSHQQPRQEADDDVVELTDRQYQRALQEADDDVVEVTEGQYRRALGYLIRIEEDEEDIDPMYRRVMSQRRHSKQVKGESSRGKGQRN
ncbi:Uncharacterized protein Rs2_04948 [Raphanus sativus]|nr:Uncharacterized protein Rs2_45185 [Raphanus sativus]KAJ4876087.1 Uncharacterized protein Rs2_41105 [Raphanus sativus]KAJ4901596.1 Uncharacterized protein Rs2_15547 [Raphanus sativus]KAJ4910327.1 Uncharacterized protein Rs2_04948 [Raphanus sativus]